MPYYVSCRPFGRNTYYFPFCCPTFFGRLSFLHRHFLKLPKFVATCFSSSRYTFEAIFYRFAFRMLSIFDRNKTFKPRRKIDASNPRYEMPKLAHEVLKASLGEGNLREAVKVPDGYEVNDWISINVVDLFNQVNLIYGSMCDDCTVRSCPVMCASPKYEYLWADNDRHKTPIKVSAPRYIELLMDWVDRQLSDEIIFPSIPGNKFPENFRNVVKTIMRRLFRVYAHIYHSHLDQIVACGAEAHLSTCFRHFMYFGFEFNLLPSKELEPLKDILSSI